VVSKDVERFSVYLLLVSFWHCRPLAASQVTGRKDMEVPHEFTKETYVFAKEKFILGEKSLSSFTQD